MHIPKEGVSIEAFTAQVTRELSEHPETCLDQEAAKAIAVDLARITDFDKSKVITPGKVKRLSAPTSTRKALDVVLAEKHHAGYLSADRVVRCLDLPRGVLGPVLCTIQGHAKKIVVTGALLGAGALALVAVGSLQNMDRGIQDMRGEMATMSRTIDGMGGRMDRMAVVIEGVGDDIAVVAGSIADINQVIADLGDDVGRLNATLGGLQEQIVTVADNMVRVADQIDHMGGHMQSLDKGINQKLGAVAADIDSLSRQIREINLTAQGVSADALAQLEKLQTELTAMRQSLQALTGAAEVITAPGRSIADILAAKRALIERLLHR